METIFLTHFYFGDRKKTFHTGLGSIIRAIGQMKKTSLIIVNDSFSWFEGIWDSLNIPSKIFNLDINKQDVGEKFENILSNLSKQIILIANFDILIESKRMSLTKFFDVLKNKQGSNEIILTSEKYYEEIEDLANYVSEISFTKF